MGLSASQARLLSITARLSDNELHSQQIANAKIRLADQTQEASREYVNSLDAQKLVYTMYDAKGNSTKVNLTPAVIYEFSELKNQYGISNSSGQLLITSTDAKHYKESPNLVSFLQSYNVQMKHNESYDEMMDIIYSQRQDLYNDLKPYEYSDLEGFDTFVEEMNGLKQEVQTIKENFASITNPGYSDYTAYYEALKNIVDNKYIESSGDLQDSIPSEIKEAYTDMYSEDPEYTYGLSFASYVDAICSPEVFDGTYPDAVPGMKSNYHTNPSVYPTPEAYHTDPSTYPTFTATKPDPSDPSYMERLLSPACWEDTGIKSLLKGTITTMTNDQIWHSEHVLAQFLWTHGYGEEEKIYTQYGAITNNAGGSVWGIGGGGAYQSTKPTLAKVDPRNIQGTLKKDENAQLKIGIKNLYCQVVRYIDQKDSSNSLSGGSVTYPEGTETWNAQTISDEYKRLMSELAVAVAIDSDIYQGDLDAWNEAQKEYEKALKKWNDQQALYEAHLAQWQADELDAQNDAILHAEKVDIYKGQVLDFADQVEYFINQTVNSWTNSVKYYQKYYRNQITNLPTKEVIDETDPKVAWYTNLWHRLNGASDINVNYDPVTEKMQNQDATSSLKWKILNDSDLKNSTWLQYALEQGIVTLEQVQKNDDIETETGLKTTKWQSKSFTSCTDIQFVDDETAIARAEAIYTRKLNDIEAKDKKYDSDIKKLDTEHNALQTEYESVKSVVDKNIERSFKAFS